MWIYKYLTLIWFYKLCYGDIKQSFFVMIVLNKVDKYIFWLIFLIF